MQKNNSWFRFRVFGCKKTIHGLDLGFLGAKLYFRRCHKIQFCVQKNNSWFRFRVFGCKKTIHGLDLGFLGAKKQFMV